MRRHATVSLLVLAAALLTAPAARAATDDGRYALAGGCYALKSAASGALVTGAAGGAYRAGGGDPEVFRMQATTLGEYLLYAPDRTFMDVGADDRVEAAGGPAPTAEWRVEGAGDGAFTLTSIGAGKALTVAGDGALAVADGGGAASRFAFEPMRGCADYPEAQLNISGPPLEGATPYSETRGLIDAHLHAMAFEFTGGRLRCGRPWHPYGIQYAMVDCPDHEPEGAGGVVENVQSYGSPVGTHDTTGWPTFRDWPAARSLSHEQVYYKWLERAWRGGLRLYVNLLVDNGVVCEIYPYKRNSCDEMENVRLQYQRVRELQDYIDAQSGGPGKGWYRIVRSPFEARRVINAGKLAVVLGIETSRLFNCTEQNDVPECTKEDIDRQLEEVHGWGVRQMELVNKFDNALGGVAGDGGTTGLVSSTGNKYETGHFIAMQTCTTEGEHEHDRTQPTVPGVDRDPLYGLVLKTFLPGGTAPLYPAPPHCNTRGLTELGAYVIRQMMKRGMIFDPDHLSVLARDQALNLVEAHDYSGVISSHSWSTPRAYQRILALGGVVTPHEKSSADLVEQWRFLRENRSKRHLFGMGYSTDMNGFASQARPRPADQPGITYPFKSFDGSVTIDKQRSGERVYDINADGVAHYGLYPDFVAEASLLGGEQLVKDLSRSAESYLQMWERAEGVRANACPPAQARVTRNGIGHVGIGRDAESLVRRAGQPARRAGRTMTFCSRKHAERRGRVVAVFTPSGRVGLVAATGRGHRAAGVRPGMRMRGGATRVGKGVFVRDAGRGRAFVYDVRRGRVRSVAVASRTAARTPARLQAYLRRARLR